MANKPNPQLVKYIEKHLAKGFHINHVKRKLAEAGHPIEAIEDAAEFVMMQKPHLKTRSHKFMILYGILLILIISGLVWFAWLKISEQLEYKEEVQDIEQTQSFKGMTDVELIKLAAKGNTAACNSIQGHNMKYACLGAYWERGDCTWERLIGEDYNLCIYQKIMADGTLKDCNGIAPDNLRSRCKSEKRLAAIDISDPVLCDDDERCLLGIVQESSDCNTVDLAGLSSRSRTYFQDACADITARKRNDVSICDDISAEGLGADRDDCIFYLEPVNTFRDRCSLLSAAEEKNDCIFEGAIIRKNADLCKDLSNKYSRSKGTCLFTIAVLLDNEDICNEISESDMSDKCKQVFSTDCKGSEDQEVKSFCSVFWDKEIPCCDNNDLNNIYVFVADVLELEV